MADVYLRQSPLAQLGLAGRTGSRSESAQVTLQEIPFPTIVNLRAQDRAGAKDKGFMDAAKKTLGFALPVKANTAAGAKDIKAFWLGPDEWWVLGPDDSDLASQLAEGLEGQAAGLTEVGESRTCIRVSGPKARALLSKGCPLDFHASVMPEGSVAQSLLAKAGVTIHCVSARPVYDIYVLRSFAEYLWLWLEDAAKEYGLAIETG